MENSIKQRFHTEDFAAFGTMLLVSCMVGIYFAYKDRNKNSIDSYFFAEKHVHPVAVGLSLAVTFQSSVGIISTPAEAYIVGTLQLFLVVVNLIGISIVSFYFVSAFHRLPINTAFQYLEMRFNKGITRVAVAAKTCGQIFYMGLVVYVPAAALNAVTPLPLTWSIVLTAGLCTFYTVLGGMKAVIWTDVLQFGMMFAGISAVFTKGLITVGGFENLANVIERGERNTAGRFEYGLISRVSPLGFLLGRSCNAICEVGFSQQMVQRYKSCKTAKLARCALLVQAIPLFFLILFNVGNGLIMYAYYEGCDPVKSGKISSIDQGIPYLVLELFANLPGIAGVFVSAVFSGALSTVSSGINSYSIVIVEDLVAPCFGKVARSERLKLILGKVMVVCLGFLLVLIAFATSLSTSNIIQILYSFAGVTEGPIGGVFFLGFFCPWANNLGAIVGFVTSFSFVLFLFIGSEFFKVPYMNNIPNLSTDICLQINNSTPPPEEYITFTDQLTASSFDDGHSAMQDLFNINFHLYFFFGVVVTVIIGIIVSLISGPNKPSEADPKLFIPLIDNSCFPNKIRKFFRFGVPELRSDEEIKNSAMNEDDKIIAYEMN